MIKNNNNNDNNNNNNNNKNNNNYNNNNIKTAYTVTDYSHLIYNRTSMAQTSLGPGKFVLNIVISGH